MMAPLPEHLVPNGYDKNWVRLCGALEGFFERHGRWPTQVRLGRGTLDDLRRHVFTAKSWKQIQTRLKFIVDENAPIVAGDEEGRSYSYGADGFPKERPDPPADVWLGVRPDRPHEPEY